MQDLGARHPAGQLSIHVDVLAVDGVANPHFGAARLGAFVHPAVHGDVRVLVNHTWRHVFALGVQLHRHHPRGQQVRRIELGTHGHKLALVDQHIGVRQHALFLTRPHRGVADPHGLRLDPIRCAVSRERIDDPGQIQAVIHLFRDLSFLGFRNLGTFLSGIFFWIVRSGGFFGVADGGPIHPSAVGGLA